jgi:DegV family protein with EDD domain
MAISYLDGSRLRRALKAGLYQLLSDQEFLNKINVFPVADGDTGTNLGLTAHFILNATNASQTQAAGDALSEIADAALDGARGNSGAILAQYFHGLADSCAGALRLGPADLSRALSAASDYARGAVSEPREGTLLTVARALADQVDTLVSQGQDDFVTLLPQALPGLEIALTETTAQLDTLRRANVVDAGAAGLVDIVRGIVRLIETGQQASADDIRLHGDLPEVLGEAAAADDLRYCTECFVSGFELDARRLREQLTSLGNSLVLAGSHRKLKVHIHTDQPSRVFDLAGSYGRVSGEKADDMHRQTHARRDRHPVAIVTDSAADLPESECERLDIHMVPIRVHLGERSYLDKVTISADEFYRQLAAGVTPLKTSQPPPGDFRRAYEFLVSHFDDVLSVQLTGQVSGTLQAARSAAQRMPDGRRVHVMDSRNVSLGQGLVTLYAAECAHAGQSIEAIKETLRRDVIPATRTYAIVRDLAYAVRGGRVPGYVKRLADLLRLTVILRVTDDGHVKARAALLGRRNVLHRFARYLQRRIDPQQTYRLAIGHGAAPDDASWLMHRLLAHTPHVDLHYVTELGSALGVHGGPGLIVVALQACPADGLPAHPRG